MYIASLSDVKQESLANAMVYA